MIGRLPAVNHQGKRPLPRCANLDERSARIVELSVLVLCRPLANVLGLRQSVSQPADMTATIARGGQVKDTQVMPASQPASFYLSGSTVGATAADAKTTVWRFTPDGKDGVAHDVAGMVAMTGEHSRLRATSRHIRFVV